MTIEAGHPSPEPAPEADERASIPRHIAIIMDGNGRWAERRGLPRLAGHRAGTENIRRILQTVYRSGIPYLTLFAFSTENWGRPDAEVKGLLEILQSVIVDEARALHEQNVRIRHLGVTERLPADLAQSIGQAVELTRRNSGLNLCVAFDYGGRDEIVEATRRIVAAGIPAEEIDESLFGRYLQTPTVPDPDLVIRTGGEFRISNFLLWQSAYSEFYSTPIHWPDFDEQEMERALEAFRLRRRRFGSLSPAE